MIRAAYDKVLALSAHPQAEPILAGVAFVESSFFPVPPDAMLIPMVLARPDRAWHIAALCTVASVIGGMLGYAIGFYAFESFGKALIAFYGLSHDFQAFRNAYQQWGLWIILIKGMTPIPYKIVTIASGLAGYDFWTFVAASIVTRGARFFLVAALLRLYGEPIRHFIEKHLTWVTTAFLAVLVGGFVAVRYIG